ncbi:MAG TPA: FkbM family methyltransferase [Burkholderiales bacterium]|nr:FkbM family methyltransferase [Burkholderiales bacterium]
MKRVETWWLPAGDTHIELYLQAYGGEYQGEHRRASLNACRRRRVALDIGAHVGLWSRELAEAFEEVLAFEPIAAFRQCFIRNVTAQNVTLYPFALGSAPGKAKMAVAADNSGESYITEAGQEGVDIRPLDELELNDVDYVKIDVEGFELFVLQGARETLMRCRPVITLEQKAHSATHFGIGQYAALEYLKALGAEVRERVIDDWILVWP